MANTLGEKVKKLRKEKKMTLEQLASHIGSGKSYIWELENKGLKKPSADKLATIASVLGVTSEYLLDDNQASAVPEVLDQAFFRDFQSLKEEDKQKIRDIVNVWKSN